jgi:hypothetical protein
MLIDLIGEFFKDGFDWTVSRENCQVPELPIKRQTRLINLVPPLRTIFEQWSLD